MHGRYKAMGFTDEDAGDLAAFKQFAKGRGWSRDRIENFLAMNGQMKGNDEVAGDLINAFYEKYRLPQAERAAFESWLGGERLAGASKPTPTLQQDVRRRAEILKIGRDNPDQYDRDLDLQDEEHDILERLHAANSTFERAASTDTGFAPGDGDGAGGDASIGGVTPAATTNE